MTRIPQRGRILVGLLALVIAPTVRATVPDTADHCIRRFLAQDDAQPRYRAIRRLEAENGSRRGWLEAATEYTPATGFRYQVIAEGAKVTPDLGGRASTMEFADAIIERIGC